MVGVGLPPGHSSAFTICFLLKRKLRRNLQTARPTPTQYGVANANICRDRQGQRAAAMPSRHSRARSGLIWTAAYAYSVWSRIGEEIGPKRAREIGVVKEIVGFKPQFQFQALSDAGVFENREVKLAERRTDKRIASQVPEMPGSWNTSLGCESTGHGKRSEIQEI